MKSNHSNDNKRVAVNCLLTTVRAVLMNEHSETKDERNIAAVDTNRAWRLTDVNMSRISGLVHTIL